jgi:hypothetical protein
MELNHVCYPSIQWLHWFLGIVSYNHSTTSLLSLITRKFVLGGSVIAVVQDYGPQVKYHPLHGLITSPSFVIECG